MSTKFGIGGPLAGVINSADFFVDRFRGIDIVGGWNLPILIEIEGRRCDGNRKSYVLYKTMTFLMIFSDLLHLSISWKQMLEINCCFFLCTQRKRDLSLFVIGRLITNELLCTIAVLQKQMTNRSHNTLLVCSLLAVLLIFSLLMICHK